MTSRVDAKIHSSFNMYFCWFINLILGVGCLSLIFAYLYLPYWFLTNKKRGMNSCLKVLLYILGILIIAPIFLVFEFFYFILTYVMGTLFKFQKQNFGRQRTAVSRMFTFQTQNTGDYQRQFSDLSLVSELDDEDSFNSDDDIPLQIVSDELNNFL